MLRSDKAQALTFFFFFFFFLRVRGAGSKTKKKKDNMLCLLFFFFVFSCLFIPPPPFFFFFFLSNNNCSNIEQVNAQFYATWACVCRDKQILHQQLFHSCYCTTCRKLISLLFRARHTALPVIRFFSAALEQSCLIKHKKCSPLLLPFPAFLTDGQGKAVPFCWYVLILPDYCSSGRAVRPEARRG